MTTTSIIAEEPPPVKRPRGWATPLLRYLHATSFPGILLKGRAVGGALTKQSRPGLVFPADCR
jgi:hypothetical protein